MAKLRVVVAILLQVLLISACETSGGSKAVPPTPPQKEEQTMKHTDEIYIGREKVPAEVAEWAENNKKEAGVSKETFGFLDAYLISLGEKPTAGYDVKVNQAGFDAGVRWLIDLEVRQPLPGEMTAQVITYPYEVLAVPAGTPVKLRLWNQKGEYRELVDGQSLILQEPKNGSEFRSLRPDGEYFLYPGPDPVYLALPQAVVTGGSVVEVTETKGEWVHLRSGDDQGWLPKWYLEGINDTPVKDIEADYKVLKEKHGGLLYPNGPVTVELEKGKLLKPIKEWGHWYFVGIMVYDIPAVQCAWIPKDVLLPLGEIEAGEGFLHEGTEVYGFDNFEKNGPVNPEKLQYTMTVYVIKEKDGYIAVQAAGGWTAWTKKENLKFQYNS